LTGTHDIVVRPWSLCHVHYNDGVSYDEVLGQISETPWKAIE
jgi:hypothetical protein